MCVQTRPRFTLSSKTVDPVRCWVRTYVNFYEKKKKYPQSHSSVEDRTCEYCITHNHSESSALPTELSRNQGVRPAQAQRGMFRNATPWKKRAGDGKFSFGFLSRKWSLKWIEMIFTHNEHSCVAIESIYWYFIIKMQEKCSHTWHNYVFEKALSIFGSWTTNNFQIAKIFDQSSIFKWQVLTSENCSRLKCNVVCLSFVGWLQYHFMWKEETCRRLQGLLWLLLT